MAGPPIIDEFCILHISRSGIYLISIRKYPLLKCNYFRSRLLHYREKTSTIIAELQLGGTASVYTLYGHYTTTWYDAKAACESFGQRLAVLNTLEKFNEAVAVVHKSVNH